MFFTFIQNNSGGYFVGEQFVIIEADYAQEANDIALLHGIYFDGVDNGIDCVCCGDRWDKVEDNDATEKPEIYGKSPNLPEFTNCGVKIIILPQIFSL